MLKLNVVFLHIQIFAGSEQVLENFSRAPDKSWKSSVLFCQFKRVGRTPATRVVLLADNVMVVVQRVLTHTTPQRRRLGAIHRHGRLSVTTRGTTRQTTTVARPPWPSQWSLPGETEATSPENDDRDAEKKRRYVCDNDGARQLRRAEPTSRTDRLITVRHHNVPW